ncbi:hypothetical protein [Mycobacteroides abscessus]|uniref:hypothetical protein n=1 Tax=Mycobacteroides abscessus TaxID=36809 RepID=UPI001877CD68|nr:hypothetical protein [Mycobacteroides abscessus]MDM2082841.1 hypothetical protein [Mycobacteroides abscessus]MDM2086015.1 hypothetical protein [Mycobacteroides abscessus]
MANISHLSIDTLRNRINHERVAIKSLDEMLSNPLVLRAPAEKKAQLEASKATFEANMQRHQAELAKRGQQA